MLISKHNFLHILIEVFIQHTSYVCRSDNGKESPLVN